MPHIVTGAAEAERWAGASCVAEGGDGDEVAEHPPRSWGLAARGATIEPGTPEFDFHLTDKIEVWSDEAARIYQQAVARPVGSRDRDPVERRVRPRTRISRTPSCR